MHFALQVTWSLVATTWWTHRDPGKGNGRKMATETAANSCRGPGVRGPRRNDEAGAVLILVLLMITVLVVLAVETLRAMQVEEAGARYFQNSFQAESLAKSGAHAVMALLLKDGAENQVDHLGEPWAQVGQPGSEALALSDVGTLEGGVADEGGKYPINALVDDKGALRPGHQQVLQHLLTNPPFRMEAEDAKALIAAIKDWLDPDDEPTEGGGAESDYYESQDKPHGCKNGPITSLAELLLVRGMPEAIYYGKDGGPGLKDLVTVYSDGKININTAGPEVLGALLSPSTPPETAASWVENVIAYRKDPMHWDFLGESDWYRNRMTGFSDINLPADLITTQSSYFSVLMTGKVGAGRKTVFACLERRKTEKDKQNQMEVIVRFWQVF
jgi:general secretion pathway protein K